MARFLRLCPDGIRITELEFHPQLRRLCHEQARATTPTQYPQFIYAKFLENPR